MACKEKDKRDGREDANTQPQKKVTMTVCLSEMYCRERVSVLTEKRTRDERIFLLVISSSASTSFGTLQVPSRGCAGAL